MTHPNKTYAIVADIGGTNTRVALADGTRVLPETIRRYANKGFDGLEDVLRQYIVDEDGVEPRATCVAVAGPVGEGQAKMTNLDWTMTNESLAAATQSETVAILNDLQAQGYAVGNLDPDKVDTIVQAPAAPEKAKLVVGVGTGFNAAPVIESVGGRIVPASESGHATLPTRTEMQCALSRFVGQTHGFPSIEDVLSGPGLENTYAFAAHQAGKDGQLPAQDIMAACAAGDAIAVQAVHLSIQILGAVCGNLALTLLPSGGIYLVGGVSRAFAPYFKDAGFAQAFADKGRFSDFMERFPIYVVRDDYAALTGCAAYLDQITNA